jgi:hypothetical protein
MMIFQLFLKKYWCETWLTYSTNNLDFESSRFTLIRINLPINNLNFGQDGSSIHVLLLPELKLCGENIVVMPLITLDYIVH